MAPAELRVAVVYCPAPGQVDACELRLPAGSTAGDALRASGVLSRHGLDLASASLGVWCRLAAADTLLRDRDRVELYRPLTVDPKEARRLRYKRRGGKSAQPPIAPAAG
jgi:putative ubiquitin-RnfH superfamily antitoxin RatB of RatAB toxin-antitoxin module